MLPFMAWQVGTVAWGAAFGAAGLPFWAVRCWSAVQARCPRVWLAARGRGTVGDAAPEGLDQLHPSQQLHPAEKQRFLSGFSCLSSGGNPALRG